MAVQSAYGQLTFDYPTSYTQADTRPVRLPPAHSSSIRSGGNATIFLTTYNGFSAAEEAAMDHALSILGQSLFNTYPITIEVIAAPLASGVLASTTPVMVSGFSGAPIANTAYSIGFANNQIGCDLDPQQADMIIRINNTQSWYTGTDQNPGITEYDLVTVFLHEMLAGLGLLSSGAYDDGVGVNECLGTAGTGCLNSVPYVFDRFVQTGIGLGITFITNFSAGMGSAFVGDDLFWNGANGVAALGSNPKLSAPNPFVNGGNLSNLDEATFPAGSANSIYTPAFNPGESQHTLGPVVLGMLRDLGWNVPNNPIAHFAVREQWVTNKPLSFSDCSAKAVSWEWDFDNDGATDDVAQFPSHTFTIPGSYPVTLTINGNPAYTTTITVEISDPPVIPYYNEFEDPSDQGFYPRTLTCDQWERGDPSTFFFNSWGTPSGSNAWVTNLGGTHNTNTSYSLESPPTTFVGALGDYFLRFDYKWAAAPGSGFNVHYSTDGGNSWSVLGGLQGVDPNADANWYNTASLAVLNNEPGWVQPTFTNTTHSVSYRINVVTGFPDVRFRINFGAGSGFAQDGIMIDNFEIQGAVLPGAALSLKAQALTNQVQLEWETTDESAMRRFVIERSADGESFNPIGELPAQGQAYQGAQYAFTDFTPGLGKQYYRIKIISPSGAESLSQVETVSFEGDAFATLQTLSSGEVVLRVEQTGVHRGSFQLLDMTGRVVYQQAIAFEDRSEQIIPVAHLSNGMYLYQVQTTRKRMTGRWRKQ
ncbi:MAG: PKD domain-containing protein [Bacteroidota bacterium]